MRRRSVIPVLVSLFALALVLTACSDDHASSDHSSESAPDAAEDHDGGHGSTGDGHDESTPVAEGARRIEVAATSFDFEPAAVQRLEVGDAGVPIVLVH